MCPSIVQRHSDPPETATQPEDGTSQPLPPVMRADFRVTGSPAPKHERSESQKVLGLPGLRALAVHRRECPQEVDDVPDLLFAQRPIPLAPGAHRRARHAFVDELKDLAIRVLRDVNGEV